MLGSDFWVILLCCFWNFKILNILVFNMFLIFTCIFLNPNAGFSFLGHFIVLNVYTQVLGSFSALKKKKKMILINLDIKICSQILSCLFMGRFWSQSWHLSATSDF